MPRASRKQLVIFGLKHINWHAGVYYNNLLHSTLINNHQLNTLKPNNFMSRFDYLLCSINTNSNALIGYLTIIRRVRMGY